jgi:hypothetical protein
MTRNDQMESRKLQAAIADIENKLFNGGASERSSTSMLVKMLNDAKNELNSVEENVKKHHDEEQRKVQAEVAAVVYLVSRETALNELEREQYGAFIARDFFTKADFNNLDEFYTHTWDRLTEGGKAEMSQRVWEGVRRDEYEFTDMPESVKQKEAMLLRDSLGAGDRPLGKLEQIPEQDRVDFIQACDSGNRKEAYKVLDRPSFAEHVSRSPEVAASKAAVNDRAANTQEAKVAETKTEKPNGTGSTPSAETLDFTDIDLETHKPSAPLAGRLPIGSNGRGN